MIPILAGLALGAAMGGGIAALQKKDILQGALMGGIGGAVGGAFMPGVAGAVGEGAISASTAAAGNPGTFIAADQAASAAAPATGIGSIAHTATPAATGGSGLFGGAGGIGNFLGANKYALAGGLAGGMMAPANEPKPQSGGNIYDMSFSQQQNPEFGQVAGAPAFTNQGYTTNSITPVEDYKPTMMAANGGIIALAEGGGLETQRYSTPVRAIHPAVTDYNAQLLQRADQQYNKNFRPLANMVPGTPEYIASRPTAAPMMATAPVAPNANSVSGLTYNPRTGRFEGEFNAPGTKKQSDYDALREEMNQMRSGEVGNMSMSEAANGGLMSSYAGGGISSLGSYSDGGQLLKGPGDGVSDDIPAQIGAKQPARLADGEFVVPARVVSELGNGSTDAGAKQLYAMMDRVQNNRKKSIGKGKVAVDAKSRKHLPA
jgi:hypothetical protein